VVDYFPIVEVPLDAPEGFEEMGTKEKFWFRHQDLGLCLYKKARFNTGEDWAEKIASELCELLELPHANYELGIFDDKNGIVSPSFVPEGSDLVLGNEVLANKLLDYPRDIQLPSQHTISNVFQAIGDTSVNLPLDWKAAENINNAIDTFIGYLLLDAWIGNSDRHHENWAFISSENKTYLAPTYDHGSSLGRNESDEKRLARLTTKDTGFSVRAYVEKCNSCLYDGIKDKKPLKTFDVFRKAAKINSSAACVWLSRLSDISATNTLELFHRLPSHRISHTAIEFAQKILEINQNRLLNFLKTL
jgi:hypothetical protein